MAGKVVCVTGASGYVASWLVKHLLQHGYTIKATVRDPNDSKKTEHLRALDGAKERLELFKANLLEDGSFDSAVDGCQGVFHTASPVPTTVCQRSEMVDPAVKGTLNVLKSCAKVASIKRVVVTSSISSVLFNGTPLTNDVLVDETWFSDASFCEDQELWYVLSKTLAETAAWKFAEEKGIDMVVINPGFVIGPPLQPTLSSTAEMILDFIEGEQKFKFPGFPLVDVRDIADAHIQALENPSAKGRYCIVERMLLGSELLQILKELYPTLQLPVKREEDEFSLAKYQMSKERAMSLGINFMPLEVSLRDTVENLKEKGFLNF